MSTATNQICSSFTVLYNCGQFWRVTVFAGGQCPWLSVLANTWKYFRDSQKIVVRWHHALTRSCHKPTKYIETFCCDRLNKFPVNSWGCTTWTGYFKCREVKTEFYRNRSMQTGSSGTLIGWKSGQTTFVPLWDRMEGAWLRTLLSQVFFGYSALPTFMIFFIAWCMNPSTFSDILQKVKTYCFAS